MSLAELPDVDKFESRIDFIPFHTCWEWSGTKMKNGYGTYGFKWKQKTSHLAHRISYRLYIGEIPEGLQIDHLCMNRGCVNPSHLEPVTSQVNNRRSNGPSGLKSRQTSCKNGHLFDDKNTYIKSNGNRICRRCQADFQIRRRKKLK